MSNREPNPAEPLTAKEAELLASEIDAHGETVIARELHVARGTVARAALGRKLYARSRTSIQAYLSR